jgi:hypothetical protein
MNRIVTISYLLSQEGQKQLIREGGNGFQLQIITVPLTDELLQ